MRHFASLDFRKKAFLPLWMMFRYNKDRLMAIKKRRVVFQAAQEEIFLRWLDLNEGIIPTCVSRGIC